MSKLQGLSVGRGLRREAGQRVTLRTVATALGLSVTTVSRALKEGPEVNRETIELVKRVAGELGYRPNLGGINLRTGKTHAIGIVLPFGREGEMNIVVASLIEGASRYMKARGYRTTIVPQLQADDPLATVRDIVEEGSVDGIVITHTTPQDDRVKYLLEVGMPFVTFGRTELLSVHPSIDLDHEVIGAEAARLLLDAGHSMPLLIAPSHDFTYGLQFVRGWRKTFAERNLQAQDDCIYVTTTTPDNGRDMAKGIMALKPDATAAFVASEEAALGFLAGLRDVGREVGKDFALITYGGTALPGFFNPPLSTFHYSNHAVGERLAAFLHRAIAGENPGELSEVVRAVFVDHHSQTFHA
ncbi:LacI family DNA-binding transcriptional regulator [Rhizobium sp. P38BS-XIX]|uniref:LacI family transcriptional regulator n=1 Tax=Rhizobium sp. P38BS-XIX TaxID=2726740 RepID=UPI0014572A50|nr:LacI family transcriptional regulator [Rhizobium sp. P38BS-XIX]NLS00524.1 LacI family DNA-binding transcriptional regulator [Rhizobium sp. P38BS-XIX]